MDRIVIVGAGAAGVTAVDTLRRNGFPGHLVLLGEEHDLPYDRPPLSKHVLSGEWDAGRVALRPASYYQDLDIDWQGGRCACGLDPAGRSLWVDGHERLDFDGLIITSGATPRCLPFGHHLNGVHVLRTARDATALRAALAQQPRVVIIGAGLVGMEVAAVTRSLGMSTTVVDPVPLPMIRQIGPAVAAKLAEVHTGHGVQLRLGVEVTELVGDRQERVVGVRLSDESLVPADCVLVAVGAVPAIGWLEGSGLTLGDGVECDEFTQAAPGIYAAGDVASWPSRRYGRRMRVEHRMNATEQATCAALNLLGGNATVFDPIPYFWSDQYDIKIQAHGVFPAGATLVVGAGSLTEDRFVALFQQDGDTVGVLGWNMPKHTRLLRQQVLADPSATVATRL